MLTPEAGASRHSAAVMLIKRPDRTRDWLARDRSPGFGALALSLPRTLSQQLLLRHLTGGAGLLDLAVVATP